MVNFTNKDTTNNTNDNECGFDNDDDEPDESSKSDQGEFLWNSVIQSQIVGSFYYGYISTQVLGNC